MAWLKFSFFGSSSNTKSLDDLKKEKTDTVKSPQSVRGGAKKSMTQEGSWGGGVSSVPYKQ
jgi:hypothetical protein